MPQVTVNSTTSTTATCTVGDFSNLNITRRIDWYLNGVHAYSTTIAGSTPSHTYTFTGLSPNTTYNISAKMTSSSSGNSWTYSAQARTLLEPEATSDYATVSAFALTHRSIQVNVNNITQRSYRRKITISVYQGYSTLVDSQVDTISAYAQLYDCSFTGLNPSTSYRVVVTISNSSNVTTYTGSTYVTTDANPYSENDNASVDYEVGLNNILLKVTASEYRSYDRTVYFDWYNTETGTSGSPYKTLSAYSNYVERDMINLQTGVQYRFRIRIINPEGVESYNSGYFYVTTAVVDHTISISTASTSNSVSVTITLNEAKSYTATFEVTLDGGRTLEANIAAGSLSRTRTWTSNITPATGYTIGVNDILRNKTFTNGRRTKNNFSWSTTVSAGSTFNLKASDWNKFTSQLSDKLSYYSITGYSFASATAGGQLKASMFNQAVNAINALVTNDKGDCVTTMSTVSKNDRVTADIINQLAECLNE